MFKPALFFDRDGVLVDLVLNPLTNEFEAVKNLTQLSIVENAGQVLAKFARKFHLVVVTNQPDVAKGKATDSDLNAVRAEFFREFAKSGVRFDDYRECRHHPESIREDLKVKCACRKPNTGMLLAATNELNIDLKNSWMIGDQDSDILCGRALNLRTILVDNPKSAGRRMGEVKPDAIVGSVAEIERILTSHISASMAL